MSIYRDRNADLEVAWNDHPVDTPFYQDVTEPKTYNFGMVTVLYDGQVIAESSTVETKRNLFEEMCAAMEGLPEGPEAIFMPMRTYRHMIEIRDGRSLYMPIVLPARRRKHWVMDQDWKQRLPRRRRRR